MRNREIIEYLLYPKHFNAHSVLYKGTYCVAFSLYATTKNKTTTHAFPFPLSNPHIAKSNDTKEEPAAHLDGNFSFLTHKFEIVYEEEKKRIESQCVFRIEFDATKTYQIFLKAKLLRKSTSNKSQEEVGLCVRKMVDSKYEPIDEQVLELKKDSFHCFERIVFRSAEFFSSADLFLSNFNYGYKLYRNKLQIADLLSGTDLAQCSPSTRMKELCQVEKRRRSEQGNAHKVQKNERMERAQLLRDFQNGLPGFYYQLLKIIQEYGLRVRQCEQFAHSIATEQNKPYIPNPALIDLSHIKMQQKMSVGSLANHYQVSTPEEILYHILLEKELLRRHIRKVREELCLLLPQLPEKTFTQLVLKQIDEMQSELVNNFVAYVDDLMPLEEAPQSEARSNALACFTRERHVWNSKIRSTPYFYIQNHTEHDRISWRRQSTLTVFVHGYQGNSFDFQKAKNYLRKHNRHTHFLIVQSISKDMSQSIESLGVQVAEQVRKYIERSLFHFSLINFIGFSLGGLIARSAFAHLKDYWPQFNLFATFSSPHLGISECENNLVNLGVWYLIKVDKVKNLKQLNFQSVKFADSLLMRLSQCQGLSHFTKVVLVCSKNDGFVPYYSTVLDHRKCEKREIRDLCRNITDKIRQMQRVQLVFDLESSGAFDKLTGRRGHIQFLDNDYFLDIFFRLYGHSM